MEIYLDKRAIRTIRISAQDAVDEGDTETLREDIIEAFSEEQVEEIERRIDSGDFYEFVSDVLDEWSGEEVDELLELLEAQLADAGIELKHTPSEDEDEEEEEEEEEDEDVDDEDLGLDDDEEEPEEDEEER